MPRKKRRPSEPAPGWAWMLFGLSIGLAVALFVYLKNGPTDILPDSRNAAQIEMPPPVPEPGQSTEPAPAAQILGDDNSDASEDSGDNDLGFYTQLTEAEVIVPDGEFDFGIDADASRRLVIQAGAFPDLQAADRRKAELALLGIESSIEDARVGGNVYYRILIGPLSDRGETNRVLRRLRQAGIDNFERQID